MSKKPVIICQFITTKSSLITVSVHFKAGTDKKIHLMGETRPLGAKSRLIRRTDKQTDDGRIKVKRHRTIVGSSPSLRILLVRQRDNSRRNFRSSATLSKMQSNFDSPICFSPGVKYSGVFSAIYYYIYIKL